jgi:hypothetical protein
MVSKFETSVGEITYSVAWGRFSHYNDGTASFRGSPLVISQEPGEVLREYNKLCRKHPEEEVRIHKYVKITRARKVAPEELRKISDKYKSAKQIRKIK